MNEILKGKTILIAEDEDDLREPLALELESWGCTVLQTDNGAKAFKLIEENRIDAILSDIRMPGGDGIALLKNVKNLNYEFPVVMFITGFSDLSPEDAYHLGAEGILAKPFDLDEMVRSVVHILTPREIRYQRGDSDPRPSQSLELEFDDFWAAVKSGDIGLGRGGIYLRSQTSTPSKDVRLSFQIRFKNGALLLLQGDGVVRWVRHGDLDNLEAGFGLEFLSLEDEIRTEVIALTRKLGLRPFIPHSAYPEVKHE